MRCLSKADAGAASRIVRSCSISWDLGAEFGNQAGVQPLRRRLAALLALLAFILPVAQTVLYAQEVSDDALYDQVMRMLVRDQSLKIDELAVEVKSGVVTVHGYVKSEKLLERVERVAKRPKGVREVVNKVTVRH